jgi:MarR family 2-MHQ and catechol resistance regulon transcriptional repressor
VGGNERRRAGARTSGVHLWLLLSRATRAMEAVARESIEATGLCLSDFGILEALLH